MNALFLHQNFPGQFRHLASHLAGQPGWTVAGLGDARNVKPQVSAQGVRVLAYKHTEQPPKGHPYLHGLESRVRRAQSVVRALSEMKKKGFTPQILCVHPSWGEAMFVREVFPHARLLAYCEFFYRAAGSDVGFDPGMPAATLDDLCRLRLRNTAHLLALTECDAGWSPTDWQARQFPPEFRAKISAIHDGVDTDIVRPLPGAVFKAGDLTLTADDSVLTYVARNLEPYRGFHTFMRALPAIMRDHPRTHVVIAGGDEVSYGKAPAAGGNWREAMLAEVGAGLDPARLHFTGKLAYKDYLSLLQVSSAHIYLTYPFVLSWSMLEAMSAGCALVASNTAPVTEVIEDGRNGLLADFFKPDELARSVGRVLANRDAHAPMRARARETILERYDLRRVCVPAQVEMLRRLL